MKDKKADTYKHHFIFVLLVVTFAVNIIYFIGFNRQLTCLVPAVIDFVSIILVMVLLHKWVLLPYWNVIRLIDDYAENVSLFSHKNDIDRKLFPHLILKSILDKYKEHQKNQEELMIQLKHNNHVLQRNNKIMDSFVQITNDILSSGDIETVLQSILDRAIDIIPNAQKGSILVYNGKEFQYKAVKGYNSEILKDFSFRLEEAFQYGSKDFFEPIIVNNVEAHNKNRLNNDKYDILKEGRGFELKSTISCAIAVDGELYGLLNLDNVDSTDAFSIGDKPLIKHLAVQIGMALKNAALLEKIIYLSRHDCLTGLYNRNYFEELMNKVLEQVLEKGGIFSVAMLDINDLKMVNDTYGHEAGDLLIKSFVDAVAARLDSNDIFARMGGDEFTIVFPDKDKEYIGQVIAGINEYFSKTPFTYCGRQILNITYSCGVTTYPTDADSIDTLIRMADSCMYDLKKKQKAAN